MVYYYTCIPYVLGGGGGNVLLITVSVKYIYAGLVPDIEAISYYVGVIS